MAAPNLELELLESVELQLGLAQTDEQLQKQVNVFLAPVLLKVGSSDENVRKKVMSILSHIQTRVKNKASITLPLDALVDQWKNDQIASIVKNFNIIYLEQAFVRATLEKRKSIVPVLLKGISNRPAAVQTTLLHMTLPLLGEFDLTGPTVESDRRLGVENANDAAILLQFMLDVLLYNKGAVVKSLNPESVERITRSGKKDWVYEDLVNAKVSILKLLSGTALNDETKLPLFIVATCDSHHNVVSKGEDGLKRLLTVSLESQQLVQRLLDLYQGTVDAVNTSRARGEATPAIKHRIVSGFLSKSIVAANTQPRSMNVVLDCLFGANTTKKLRQAGIIFLQWIVRMGETKIVTQLAPQLFEQVMRLLQEPADGRADLDTVNIRSSAFSIAGLLCQRAPALLRNNIGLMNSTLQLFLNAFESEATTVRLAIQEGLSTIQTVLTPPPQDAEAFLEMLLLENMTKASPLRRLSAVRFSSIFPYDRACARFVCLLGVGDNTSEVREEAKLAMAFPYNRPDTTVIQNVSFPGFNGMLEYIEKQIYSRQQRSALPPDFKSDYPIVETFAHGTFSELIRFLRACLIVAAVSIERSSQDALRTALANVDLHSFQLPADLLKPLRLYLNHNNADAAVLARYRQLLLAPMRPQNEPGLISLSSQALRELALFSSNAISIPLVENIPSFKSFANSSREETRDACAHLIALALTSSSSLPSNNIASFLEERVSLLADQQAGVEVQQSALLGVGYIIGDCIALHGAASINSSLLQRSVEAVAQQLVSPLSRSSALHALSEISRYVPMSQVLPSQTLEATLKELSALLQNTKETRVAERAALTLGHIAVGDVHADEQVITPILNALFSMADKKHIEVHLAIGEALSALTSSWSSDALIPYRQPLATMDVDQVNTSPLMTRVLTRILSEIVPSTKPSFKQASCLWLLSLVKFNGRDPALVSRLIDVHGVFSRLMSDRDDFTQESASRGIGLVFELGDASLRASLVESLVGSLTGTKQVKTEIDDETPLFDENLGAAPSGGEISTYKELCSLASELNQPDLVYKFINLAGVSAMWTSRRGAAFGFSSIAAQAGEQLAPFLPSIIPKLYRYRFDPNPKVNAAMQSIWKSLVPDTKRTIDRYFDVILNELLVSMGNRLWRVREASTLGLADLLTGRELAQLEPSFEEIWRMSLRVMDDIKESVRSAGATLCRLLSSLTVRLCDPEQTKQRNGSAQAILAILMPFLLEKGVLSDSEDVRRLSLDTICKLCKRSGILLRPYIADTVAILIEALSSLEPQALNYMAFHVDKYNISKDELDQGRLAAAKSSPLMEAIEACIDGDRLNGEVVNALMPKLLGIVRKGVGLSTKAAAARVCLLLADHHVALITPHAATMLQALSGAVQDPSSAVLRKTMAIALGHVANHAPQSSVEKLVLHLRKLYLDSSPDDLSVRSVGGMASLELVRAALLKARSAAALLVPVAFLGAFDGEEEIANAWNECLDECAAGKEQAARKHFDGVITLLTDALQSPSWPTRKQAAQALTAAATAVGGDVLTPVAPRILQLLLASLVGKTYKGKEAILSTLTKLVLLVQQTIPSQAEPPLVSWESLIQALVTEARKKDLYYRRAAVDSLEKILECPSFSSSGVVILDQVWSVVQEVTAMITSSEAAKMDTTAPSTDDDRNERPLRLLLHASVLRLIGPAWPNKTVADASNPLVTTLLQCLFDNLKDSSVWTLKVAALDSLSVWVQRTVFEPTIAENIGSVCNNVLDNARYPAVIAAVLKLSIQLLKTGSPSPTLRHNLSNVRAKALTVDGITPEVIDLADELAQQQ